jgi:hypothetical protein
MPVSDRLITFKSFTLSAKSSFSAVMLPNSLRKPSLAGVKVEGQNSTIIKLKR